MKEVEVVTGFKGVLQVGELMGDVHILDSEHEFIDDLGQTGGVFVGGVDVALGYVFQATVLDLRVVHLAGHLIDVFEFVEEGFGLDLGESFFEEGDEGDSLEVHVGVGAEVGSFFEVFDGCCE